MSTLETLIERNHDFAEQQFTSGLPIMPTLGTMVISCVDPRVDPAHLLGLEPGEPLVLRNIGGRRPPLALPAVRLCGGAAPCARLKPHSPFKPCVYPLTEFRALHF